MPAGRDQVAAMQRLVRIMAVLDQAGSVGATRDQLVDVAGYGDADPGSQLAADLRHLRTQGWQIDNVSGVGETARYRMVPGDNRLRVRLTPGQLAALQRAVILADRAEVSRTLGVRESSLPPGIGTHVVPDAARGQLTHALDAVRLRSRLSFDYKGSRRTVDPAGVRCQNQQWYLSGCEVTDQVADSAGDGLVKHFVVARMSDTSLDRPGTAAPVSPERDLLLHPLAWQVDPPQRVVLAVPADFVPDAERWLRTPDTARAIDDEVELACTVTNRAAFRARIYVLGVRVRVLAPESFRNEMLAELRDLAGR